MGGSATVRNRPEPAVPPCTNRTFNRNQLAMFGYRITSSARRTSDCGMFRPSALAVLRLSASSSFVDRCTGRSAPPSSPSWPGGKRRAARKCPEGVKYEFADDSTTSGRTRSFPPVLSRGRRKRLADGLFDPAEAVMDAAQGDVGNPGRPDP